MGATIHFGGPIFWVLAVEAIVSFFIYFERLVEMRRAQIDYQDFLKGVFNVLDAGNTEEALAICDDSLTPVANVTATAIRLGAQTGESSMKDAVDTQARAEIGRLRRRLGTLQIMGDIAPLIGLFGTIIGFISTLLKLDGGIVVSRAELTGGIMEALVCAAAGLLVTILIFIMHGSLSIRLERIALELEAAVGRIAVYMFSKKVDE